MENIRNYISDDDEDSSAEEKEIVLEIPSACNSNNEKERKCLPSASSLTGIDARFNNTSTHSDFFNFESHLRDKHKAQSATIAEEQVKERSVITSSGNVEIPIGDFWNDFVPPEQNESKTVSASKSSEVKNSLKRHDINKQNHYDDPISVNKYPKLYPQPSNSDYNHSVTKGSIQTHNDQRVSTIHHDQPTSSREPRKMFYIHSKVSPYMHGTPACQRCRRITKSWAAHGGIINRINWNVPNFSHLLLSAGQHTEIFVWNVWSTLDPCVATLKGHKKSVKHAEWSPDGRKVLSCSYDRTALLTVVETGTVLLTCDHPGFVTAGCHNPGNPNTFLTGTDNLLLLWDSRMKGVPVRSFSYKDKFGQVQDVAFTSDQELVSCSDTVSRDSADRALMVWDLRSAVVLSNQVYQERYSCTRLKATPSKQQFLAQSQGGYIGVFSTARPYKMDKRKRFEGHKTEGYSIGFDISPDGSLVYSGSSQGGVACYDYRTGRLIGRLSDGQEVITDVACHPILPAVVATSTWGGALQLAGL